MGLTAQDLKTGFDEAMYTIHPFVITIYIMAFSLIINHRLNYCYQRYWESCSNIFMMSSKWIDSATTLAAFHYQSIVYEEDRPRSFGDVDKPMDQLKEKDKNKSAPSGGNTRTAMVNPVGFNPMGYYGSDGGDLDITLASDTSDSASSSISASHEPSSLTASATRQTSMESRRSFFSASSRQRIRKHSEEENYNRAKQQFSSSSLKIENSFRQNSLWRRLSKRKRISKPSLSDSNDGHSSRRQNSIFKSFNDSSLLNLDAVGNTSESNVGPVGDKFESNQSRTPPRNNTSTFSRIGPRRGQMSKHPSMPTMQSQSKGSTILGFSRRARRSISERTHHRTEGISTKDRIRHRRVPSSDIPERGAGGSVVKSFKPNPSLAWQRQNRTAMPRNTGLHSTVFHSPIDFDFEKVLLKEEKERQKDARQRQLDVLKQRQGTARKRSSFPSISRSSIARAISNTNSVISENSPERIASDPTRGSVPTRDKNIDINGSLADSTERPTLPIFLPRLELHDLPSLFESPSVQKSVTSIRSRSSATKKAKLESDAGSVPIPLSPFSPGFSHHSNTNVISSNFQPPVQNMNGRASLFLQEAAHLYSLMSAVAMSSLRADMEGVSSPLCDYVPGQVSPT